MSLRTILTIGLTLGLASLAGCVSEQSTPAHPSSASLRSAAPGAGDALGSSLFGRQAADRPTGVATTDDAEK